MGKTIAERQVTDLSSLIEALQEIRDLAEGETLYAENSTGISYSGVSLAEVSGSRIVTIT